MFSPRQVLQQQQRPKKKRRVNRDDRSARFLPNLPSSRMTRESRSLFYLFFSPPCFKVSRRNVGILCVKSWCNSFCCRRENSCFGGLGERKADWDGKQKFWGWLNVFQPVFLTLFTIPAPSSSISDCWAISGRAPSWGEADFPTIEAHALFSRRLNKKRPPHRMPAEGRKDGKKFKSILFYFFFGARQVKECGGGEFTTQLAVITQRLVKEQQGRACLLRDGQYRTAPDFWPHRCKFLVSIQERNISKEKQNGNQNIWWLYRHRRRRIKLPHSFPTQGGHNSTSDPSPSGLDRPFFNW